MDGQSLRGKVVAGVARRCRAQRKPVIALTGCLRPDAGALYAAGLTAAFSINQQPQTFEEAVRRSPDAVRATVDSVLRCFHAFHITGEMQ